LKPEADHWHLLGHPFSSRLLLGTGKFASVDTMLDAVRVSGAQLVTVALRRFNPGQTADDLHGPLARLPGVTLVPNTSGARDAAEAVRAARLGRELSGSPFVKLEIHPTPHHLLPDPIETYAAARELARDGFVVMPYMPADPVLARRLEDVGCACVMPLGAAIGTGHGLRTREMVELMIRDCGVPVIVDAGYASRTRPRPPSKWGAAPCSSTARWRRRTIRRAWRPLSHGPWKPVARRAWPV
jgi:thiazole synthase